MMPAADRRTAVALFLTCWVVLTLHFATNISREHYPAMSLAERGTLAVDEYVDLHPDLFVAPNGHAYINNNPGVALVAAVPLVLFRPALQAAEERGRRQAAAAGGQVSAEYADHRPNRLRFYRQVRERGLDLKFGLVAVLVTAFCMSPLTALSGVLLFGTLRRLQVPQPSALLYAFLLVLGTPLFFRNGYLNHNQVLGVAVFAAFVILWRPGAPASRPAPSLTMLAGVLGGYAVFCDYSAIVPLLFLLAYACLQSGSFRGVLLFAAGAAIPIAGLLAYQWSAFGSPFRPAQGVMPETTYSGLGYRGMAWPAPDLIAANLFDPRFGLFAFGPILLLGVPGLWLAPRTWLPRRAKILLGVAGAAFLLFCSANQFARLQWNTGVRYLVPAIPFLMLGVVVVLERLPHVARWLVAGGAFAYAWPLAMVRESVPESLWRVATTGPELPWLTVLGKMAPQYLSGLDGPPSPWPFLVAAAAAIAVIWWWHGRDQRQMPHMAPEHP